jgi:DDE superfamily endonuclease/Tc5 transposase DNA-binding domain
MTKRKPSQQDGNLEYGQKELIIKHKQANPSITLDELAAWTQNKFHLAYKPSKSTMSRTLTRKDQYLGVHAQDRIIRRRRVLTHADLEEALVLWVLQKQHQKLSISREMIREKGKRFAQDLRFGDSIKFSDNWITLFCKRNAFRQFRQHGESGAANIDSPAIQLTIESIRTKIDHYGPRNTYNFDESGLFYNMPPDTTIARQQIEGAKKDKIRISIGFTCNADGSDKWKPLFIGHAKKPRCFERKTGQEHGFLYYNNKKAWMTGSIFQDYLRHFDRHVNRPVLLLIDNAPSHIFEGLELQNVEILCLPPNTTSKLQPLDAGIIATFKKHYRRRQIAWGLDQLDVGENPYKVNQLQAMRWVRMVWNALNPLVIGNCWRHTGLLDTSNNNQSNIAPSLSIDEEMADMEFAADFNNFIRITNIQSAMPLDDFLNPASESDVHEFLTDEQIIETVQQVEDENEEDEEQLAPPSPYLNIPKSNRIVILAQTIAFIENTPDGWKKEQQNTVQCLRRMQRDLRNEVIREQEEKRTQTSITSFFNRIN